MKHIAIEYSLLLLKAGLPLEKAILFGSYSSESQKEYSDIDLAIVLKEYHKDRFNTRLRLMKYSRDFDDVIEVHPFLSSEFDKSNPFVKEIIESGIEIYPS